MKIDGITLLQMIKDNKLKDNTKIDVSYLDAPIYYVIAKLTYKDNELNWEPGTFRVSMLYDDYYTFEIIEEIEKTKKIELLNIKDNAIKLKNGKYGSLTASSKIIAEQQNEIAKAVNYLLEKSNKDE